MTKRTFSWYRMKTFRSATSGAHYSYTDAVKSWGLPGTTCVFFADQPLVICNKTHDLAREGSSRSPLIIVWIDCWQRLQILYSAPKWWTAVQFSCWWPHELLAAKQISWQQELLLSAELFISHVTHSSLTPKNSGFHTHTPRPGNVDLGNRMNQFLSPKLQYLS